MGEHSVEEVLGPRRRVRGHPSMRGVLIDELVVRTIANSMEIGAKHRSELDHRFTPWPRWIGGNPLNLCGHRDPRAGKMFYCALPPSEHPSLAGVIKLDGQWCFVRIAGRFGKDTGDFQGRVFYDHADHTSYTTVPPTLPGTW